jgi:hypothetical protein
MASITKYRNKWLKYHASYEKRAVTELQKVFRKWSNVIINTEFKDQNILNQLSLLVPFEDLYSTYYQIYYNIGVTHGLRVAKDINLELKAVTINDFMKLFEEDLPLFLRQFGITRMQLVHNSYIDVIFKMFNDRLKEGKTLRETTDEIFEIMRSPRFYKWEAERIARTETTGAANYSAVKAGAVSGFLMQKQWISALDARTRRTPPSNYDHREMNGQRVGLKEDFVFNPKSLYVDQLNYPGDPKGQAGNVINCRCTVAVVPARDKNGRLIRTT